MHRQMPWQSREIDALMVVKGQFLLVCGQDRDGPLSEGKLLLSHAPAEFGNFSGTADKSLEGQQSDSRIEGQAVPEEHALVGNQAEVAINLASDVTLQAADDLHLRQPFFEAAFDVRPGRLVRSHAGEHDSPQGMVGLTVASGVEPKATGGLARRSRDRGDTAQVRPGGFGAQPLGMVAGGDEEDGGDVGADAVKAEQARRA